MRSAQCCSIKTKYLGMMGKSPQNLLRPSFPPNPAFTPSPVNGPLCRAPVMLSHVVVTEFPL